MSQITTFKPRDLQLTQAYVKCLLCSTTPNYLTARSNDGLMTRMVFKFANNLDFKQYLPWRLNRMTASAQWPRQSTEGIERILQALIYVCKRE